MAVPQPRVYKLLRRQSLAFLAAAVLASICLILLGALLESRSALWSRLVVVVGSSGLGACLGLVFGSLTGASALQRVTDLVEKTLDSQLSAADEDLQPFRRIWHQYLKTSIDGKPVWRHRVYDFGKMIIPGKLIASLDVQGPEGESHTYAIEAFIATPRLVVIQRTTSGSEPPIIHVYPFATERFRNLVAGTAFLQAWDGTHFVTPALLKASPVDLGDASAVIGTLPEDAFTKLERLWEKYGAQQGLGHNDPNARPASSG